MQVANSSFCATLHHVRSTVTPLYCVIWTQGQRKGEKQSYVVLGVIVHKGTVHTLPILTVITVPL